MVVWLDPELPTRVRERALTSQAQIDSSAALTLTDEAVPRPPTRRRSILIDTVRGMAIALVALGHTDQGVSHRGWWGGSTVGLHLELFIYSFHMPAFFFISGVFLPVSLARHGVRRFLGNKVGTMLWPYVLWTTLGAALTVPLSRFLVQATPSPRQLLFGILTGTLSWFLPTIFFAVFVGMLGALANARGWMPMPGFFLLAVAVAATWHWTGINFIDRAMLHLPFLAAGMWAGRSYEAVERIPVAAAVAGVLAVAAGLLYATTYLRMYQFYWFLPLGLVGTLMLLLLARCLGRSPTARIFSWWGEASFGIFLISPYFQGLGRELLRAVHITEPYLQLLVPTLLAISVPAWLYQHRFRLHMNWMFLWPSGKQV